jgi:hypothetical protein
MCNSALIISSGQSRSTVAEGNSLSAEMPPVQIEIKSVHHIGAVEKVKSDHGT